MLRRTLFTSHLTAIHARKPLGPKSLDVFNVADLVALLSRDFTYANSKTNVLNLKTHMIGEGKCGDMLSPENEDNNVQLMKKLNTERLTFHIILSLRYPSIWKFSQALAQAREDALLETRDKPSIYFDRVAELLNITIFHRDLGKNEIFPSADHLGVQQIRRLAENMFGYEVRIGCYSVEEIKQAEQVKTELLQTSQDPYQALKSFNPREFLSRYAAETATIAAADEGSEKIRGLLM